MAAAKKPSVVSRIQRTESYAEKVRLMFAQTVNEILALNKTMPILGEGEMFSFDGESMKKQKQVEALLRQLRAAATLAIQKGIRCEWEEANKECDEMIKSVFGKEILSSTTFNGWNNRNTEAMNAFLNRSDRGMNLSDRVWKATRQLRDEMEVAITLGIGEGDSAASMSRKVRQYLNDPDLMFRRFRVKIGEKEVEDVDADGKVIGTHTETVYGRKWKKKVKGDDGKVRWIDYDKDSYKDQWTGKGYYKSSAQNAMRVTRTETNIAYRRADKARWNSLDFILGVHIEVSNHTRKGKEREKDICDKLQGDYPKDFNFDGWHPQCFCIATPILMDEEEMVKKNEAFLKGETYTPKGKPIKDYPEGFKNWVKDNEDKILNSRDRGTEPYFIRNNAAVVDEILNPQPKALTIAEKAKIRHDARTPEQIQEIKDRAAQRQNKIVATKKYGTKVLDYMKGISDVDTSVLAKALNSGNITIIAEEAKKLKGIGKEILSLSKLDDPMAVAKKFSFADAKSVNNAVISRLARESFSSLSAQKTFLEGEIKWVEEHKKYNTWEVARDAYKKELASVNRLIEVKAVSDSVQDAILFATTQSKDATLKALAMSMKNALADKSVSLETLKIKADELNTRYKVEYAKIKSWIDLQTKAATALAYASTTSDTKFKSMASSVNLLLSSRSGAISTATKKVNELNAEYKKLYDAEIAAKYKITPVVTIDDIIDKMGNKTPKTLRELNEAIKKFKYTDSELKANEIEINALMKKMFDENDFGMDIDHDLLESVFDKGFLNTFQSGSSHGYCGSRKTTGQIEKTHGRLKMAHKMFLPSTHGELNGSEYKGTQLKREDYEKYGHLLDRDKYECYQHNKTHYGDVQVRFKKDKVLCTWTFDDSLHGGGSYFQPSLTSDPHVESFDEMCWNKPTASSKWDSVSKWQRETGTSYVELQYHGEVTIDFVDNMTFNKSPETYLSQDLIRKLLSKGIELWYVDGGKIVMYKP